MSKVIAVEACTAVVPLNVRTAFATRVVHERHYSLVRVWGDDQVHGIGFCYSGSSSGTLATSAVLELLAPVVLGEDPFRSEGLWDAMYQEALLHGRTGAVMRALSAVDIALWDRNARSVGLPIWRYLGSVSSGTVPTYASGGYYLEGKGPRQLAEEVTTYVEAGFKAIKIKVGRLDPASEEDRVAAARNAIGTDILLMLDANNAWKDLPSALQTIRRFEPYEPYWIEEPFSPDDIANHARLARNTPIPIATGEIEAGRWRNKALLDSGAVSILQTDAAVCGGITEFRRIAALASAYGVSICPHWFHDLHAPLVGATGNAQFVEYFPDDGVLNFRILLDHQLEIRNGEIVLHQTPGLGFDFEEAMLAKYSDGWERREL